MRAVRDHDLAVAQLRRSYAAVPPGQPVRLAKRTSNLFRPRGAPRAPGLDVSGLGGVLGVDPVARTAEVQGMCTYERSGRGDPAHGLMPLVVPQLRTITLGGAVTGLGIESTSFRNGLPHESVTELDVLTGAGEVVTARPEGEHADLFAAFPNSLGSLGYATRLRIELQPVRRYVALRNVRFTDLDELIDAIGRGHRHPRLRRPEPVDAMDGVMFSPGEAYLVLGDASPTTCRRSPTTPARTSTTGRCADAPARRADHARLPVALGHRLVLVLGGVRRAAPGGAAAVAGAVAAQRRLPPHRAAGAPAPGGGPDRPVARPAGPGAGGAGRGDPAGAARPSFLHWFARRVRMTPVWLCPLRLREPAGAGSARSWPLYPLRPGQDYVNIGFWGSVPIAEGAADGDVNREIERAVSEAGGHKSLYSDAYYDRDSFDRLYGGDTWRAVQDRYDPEHRLTGLYEKAVARA